MSVITKETAMMNYLFNFLYDVNNDKDFIEELRDELREDDFVNILNSSDEKTKKLFEEPFSVKDIKEFLKKANDTFTKITEENELKLTETLEKFDNADILKDCFLSRINTFDLKAQNSAIYIEEYYNSVLKKIIFENSEIYLNDNVITDEKIKICCDTIQLTEENGSYILEMTNLFTDEHYKIKFDNITVSLKAYRAESDYLCWSFVKTPWDYITALANNINEHLNYGIANQKEKQIFGLIKLLTGEKFSDINSVPSELYNLIEKHNLKKVIKPPYDFTKPYLCKKKFEPFWRDIFNLISESQRELPSYFDETVSKEAFESHKQLITEQMNALGYTGTYPDYYKKDSVMKPTLLKTYNLSHVVAFEKFAEHHIHCYSFENGGVIQTTFFVGTIFNKNEHDKTDIFSTMFDCNGKAVFSILSTTFAEEMNAETYENRTQKAVKSAVKKSDLKKSDIDDYFFKSPVDAIEILNLKTLLLAFIMFSFGFSLIVPLLLIILEGSTISEVVEFMKSEPFMMFFGVIGGFVATFLVALFEWLSGRK